MIKMFWAALALVAAVPAHAAITEARTTAGVVQGEAADGIGEFKGIPFAAPPVGDLRWKAPQPVQPWQGVRQTVAFGPACMQGPILAQMGSFVPARRAKIGAVDRLFSRVGAADDIARGRSTFMVEMVETAAILNQAGERALVILDEIGRGTATFDGLSIAWATIEHLHETNRCRALFATHFHELTALAAKLPRLFNATVRVKEWQGEVVFLHEVVPGAADRSYGIQVAKLAGLPATVIERAKVVLAKLEAEDRASPRGFDDLPLFAAAPRPSSPATHDSAVDSVVAALAALHPDEMSPRDALEALYALKTKAAVQGS